MSFRRLFVVDPDRRRLDPEALEAVSSVEVVGSFDELRDLLIREGPREVLAGASHVGSPRAQPAGKSEARESLYRLLSAVPIPALLAAIGVLWTLNLRTPHESLPLLIALNVVFSVLASALVAYLVARSFLASGAPGLLMLGCGVLIWGAAAFVGLLVGGHNVGVLICVHNVCVCVSALCHLVGVTRTLKPRLPVRGPRVWLAVAYIAALGFVTLVAAFAHRGWMPVFFIQGQGGTTLRDIVLGSAIGMFAVTAVLLWMQSRKSGSVFAYWYSLALGLIAVGLFGIMLETVHANALSWVGRSAQFLSGVYMLIAAISSVRESGSWTAPLERTLRETQQRYRTLFDSMTEGFALHEIICDESGNPCDYRFLDVNPAFERQTGLKRDRVIGRTVLEILPGVEPSWIETYGKVALTGDPVRFSQFSKALKKHFEVYAFSPTLGQFAVLFFDVTEHRQSQEEAERHRELLAAVADNTDAHLVYLDRDFNFVWVNPAYAKACARTQEEFVGHNHFEFYPNEENQAIFERVRDTGIPFEIKEKPFVFPDHPEWGTTYWDWTLTPITDEDGVVQNLVFSLMDTTHDVRAREELAEARAESEQRAAELQSFIHGMADGAALTDAEGNVLWMNDAGRDILGVPESEDFDDWMSRYQRLTLDGELLPLEEAVTFRALRGEWVSDFVYKVITPHGREITLSVSASPVRDPQGKIVGSAHVVRDVTERAEFERRREELYAREHRIAETLQQVLIPGLEYNVPGMEIAVSYEAALEEARIGGDFYDVFEIGDGRYGILIGDVLGKGLRAAIRVAEMRHAVRSYAYLDPRPSRVMTLANQALCRSQTDLGGMATAFFAVIHTGLGSMTYTNCGHETPLLMKANGSIEELESTGLLLGVSDDSVYIEDGRPLQPGDLVVMVTDGITEARPRADHLFGLAGVKRYLREARASRRATPGRIAEGLMKAAKAHAGGGLTDDAAIVAFRLRPT